MTAYKDSALREEAYQESAALVAELVFEKGRILAGRSPSKSEPLSVEDERALAETIDRLRAAIITQAEAVRQWRCRHERLGNKLQRRFSVLEGLLARHHLRLHWLLYRRAMRSFIDHTI